MIMVSGCNIDDRGVHLLCEAIANHPSLTSMNLRHNRIGDVGLRALGDLFAHNRPTHLIAVDLRYNAPCTESGLVLLSRRLEDNTSITLFDIFKPAGGTPGDLSMAAIRRILQRNRRRAVSTRARVLFDWLRHVCDEIISNADDPHTEAKSGQDGLTHLSSSSSFSISSSPPAEHSLLEKGDDEPFHSSSSSSHWPSPILRLLVTFIEPVDMKFRYFEPPDD